MRAILSVILSSTCFVACAGPIDSCTEKDNALWEGLRAYQGPVGKQDRINQVIGQGAWGFDNPLTVAVWFGYDDIVEELIRNHELLDKYGGGALYVAASMGRLKEMSLLLDAGVSPDAEIENGYTPIYGAADYGCLRAIQLLIDSGASMSHRTNAGRSLLGFAVTSRQFETARYVIKQGYIADEVERRSVEDTLRRMGMDSMFDFIFEAEKADPTTGSQAD